MEKNPTTRRKWLCQCLFEHGHVSPSCKYQCVLAPPPPPNFLFCCLNSSKNKIYCCSLATPSLDTSGIVWVTAVGLICKSWNLLSCVSRSTSYLLSPSVTYPWSHRTLLKLLFPGLLSNPFDANVVRKWGTKKEKRLRKDPVTKIIVSKSTQLQYLWRVTQIRNNMELTHLPQIFLYLLLVHCTSYFCHFFLRNNFSFLRYVLFSFVHVFVQRFWNWWSTNSKSNVRGIISDCVPDTIKLFISILAPVVDIQACRNFNSVICLENYLVLANSKKSSPILSAQFFPNQITTHVFFQD